MTFAILAPSDMITSKNNPFQVAKKNAQVYACMSKVKIVKIA